MTWRCGWTAQPAGTKQTPPASKPCHRSGRCWHERQDLVRLQDRRSDPAQRGRHRCDGAATHPSKQSTQLRSLGAEIVEAELPAAQHAVAAYYLLATSEAASNLARYDGVHYGWRSDDGVKTQAEMTTATRSEGFGDEVQLRILLGTFATSIGYSADYYDKARLARRGHAARLCTRLPRL